MDLGKGRLYRLYSVPFQRQTDVHANECCEFRLLHLHSGTSGRRPYDNAQKSTGLLTANPGVFNPWV